MSFDEPINTLLAQLEPTDPSEASQLTAKVREQIKSIADPYREKRGQIGLFTGAHGTGKTLAARVLGSKLGYDIFRVDLAAVTSKHIGEPEKILSSQLDTASLQDVVLLFDEADSLFGKRNDIDSTNDRYANPDKNYLLERIEAFKGLVILTTNSRNDLDQVILGKLAWVVDFASPAPKRRRSWWERVLGWFRNS